MVDLDAPASDGRSLVVAGGTRANAQTLDRGLQVLEAVARSADPMSATEIAAAIGIHRTVAHRLAGTLARRGYLHPDGDGRHRLGTAILALASVVTDVRAVARPFLEDLVRRTEETVQLVALSGTAVVFIDGLESSQTLRVSIRNGRTVPAHATSVGKAWLATLGQRQLHDLYPDEQLPQLTPQTISTRTMLEEVLVQVRQAGYAVNDGESESGVGSVGVVVQDSTGSVRAALSVAVPLYRLTDERRKVLAEALHHTAAQVGERLSSG